VQEVTVAPITAINAMIVKIRFIFVVFRFENKPDVAFGWDLKAQERKSTESSGNSEERIN
jgi:hypothetical protein